MCLIAVVGLCTATWLSGPVAAIPVMLFWAGPGFWWGWRLAHLGVVAEETLRARSRRAVRLQRGGVTAGVLGSPAIGRATRLW